MQSVIDFLVIPTLMRVAGSNFPLPGRKALRRYAIPIYLWYFHQLPVISGILMSLVFTFNLDEIEEWRVEEIFLWGLGIGWCLYPISGIASGWISCVWLYVVMASNRKIWPWNDTVVGMDWRYAEIIVGIAIASVIQFS